MRIVNTDDVAAPYAVGMARPDKAEVLHYLAHFRIVDVESQLVVAGRSGAIEPAIRSADNRSHLAADVGADTAPVLESVRRGIVRVHEHAVGRA